MRTFVLTFRSLQFIFLLFVLRKFLNYRVNRTISSSSELPPLSLHSEILVLKAMTFSLSPAFIFLGKIFCLWAIGEQNEWSIKKVDKSLYSKIAISLCPKIQTNDVRFYSFFIIKKSISLMHAKKWQSL